MQKLIGRCRNTYGPLSSGERQMLLDLLCKPTQAQWNRCYGIIVSVLESTAN